MVEREGEKRGRGREDRIGKRRREKGGGRDKRRKEREGVGVERRAGGKEFN